MSCFVQTERYARLMTVMAREKWTDERLDDLNVKVDRGFDRLDADIRTLRMETRAEFIAVRAEMKAGFEATQRLIIQVGGGMIGTMILGFAGLLVS